ARALARPAGRTLRAVTISGPAARGAGWEHLRGQRPSMLASKEAGCASPSADRSGASALLEHPRANSFALTRCASRAAPCPTPRALRYAPASLHSDPEPPLAALALRRA
ncbi:MAG: hypothetical protein ACREIA_16325, partial [Opitutaceae bacterium]